MVSEAALARRARSALERLKAGAPVFGVVQTIAAPRLTQAALKAGLDFVILDCQRGEANEAAHRQSITLARDAGGTMLVAVRIKEGDWAAAPSYAHMGAGAVLAPDIESAEQACALVAAARSATGAPLLFAMIESRAGAAAVEEIANVDGIDGLLIGPTDLSADLGAPNQFASAEYRSAFARAETAAQRRGLILGSKAHEGFSLTGLMAAGHTFLVVGSDIEALRLGCAALNGNRAPAQDDGS